MKSKLINEIPKTYVLVLDTGDEVVGSLTEFAKKNKLLAASLTAIGAFSDVDLGYFDFAIKDYRKIPIAEQVELLSLMGDIAMYDGEPKLHVHAVVGKADGTAHGGHLLKAHVKPTLEVVLTELSTHLQREMDEEIGIPLIRL